LPDRYGLAELLDESPFLFSTSSLCVLGLLPDRKEAHYQSLLQSLNVLAALLTLVRKPERVIFDFATSLVPAVVTQVKRIVQVRNYHCPFFVSVLRWHTPSVLFPSQSGHLSTYSKLGLEHGIL
jgi:hypothetical protein